MRSCIYCGRELQDKEQCNCPGAQMRRAAKTNAAGSNNSGHAGSTGNAENSGGSNQNGYYRTGYTGNDGRIKRKWHRIKTKQAERRNRVKNSKNAKGVFSAIWKFIKSPAESILNPKAFSMPQMALIAAAQGAIIGMGIYFVATGASRSWFGFLANLIGFRGLNGYRMILNIIMSAVSGAVGGTVLFFIYSGVFYAINRLIFKSYNSFTSFLQRLILTNTPFTVFAAVGVLLAMFSTTTLMILLICGAMSSFVMTYISLCGEWSSHSESKVFYAMLLGYFIMFTFICSLLRISII